MTIQVTCSLCGDPIHPGEEIVHGTKDGVQFHSDCYLAEEGFPEELIDKITIHQESPAHNVVAILDLTGDDVEEP